jgi:hypothetical protein
VSADFPALGFDPAPGDPDEQALIARSFGRAAGELDRLATVVARLCEVSASWRGGSAEAFARSVSGLPERLRAASSAFGHASVRLSAWSVELVGLQAEARAIEREAAAAVYRLDVARAGLDAATGGWAGTTSVAREAHPAALDAVADLRRAQARGSVLQERAQAGARVVAVALREAARTAPQAPLLARLGQVARSPAGVPLAAWVRANEEELSVAADAATVVAVPLALLPPAGPFVAAALRGVALGSHSATAAYADGSVKDVGMDVAGFATLGVARVASAGAASARGAGRVSVAARRDAMRRRADEAGSALTTVGLFDVAARRLGGPPTAPPADRRKVRADGR